MKRCILAFGITILFILSALAPLSLGYNVNSSIIRDDGNTLYVGGSGAGNYSTIQSAINAANHGDTIFVFDYSSPYVENIVVDKSINLIGEDKNTTVIDGNYISSVIYIKSDDVIVSGFTLKNIEGYGYHQDKYACIRIDKSENVLVSNNIITPGKVDDDEYGAGIYLYDSSNNLIENNTIYNDNNVGGIIGVSIRSDEQKYSKFNYIEYNEIHGCDTGIRISPYTGGICNDNIVYKNNIHHVRIGISISAYISESKENLIFDNIINSSVQWGVDVLLANNNKIYRNTITNTGLGWENHKGIYITGDNNKISNNTISYNNPVGIHIRGRYNIISNNLISHNKKIGLYVNDYYNIIYQNNFINNHENANDESDNIWNDGKYGNYWSDYKEKYPDAKKRQLRPWMWNTPYEIPGGDNRDMCPLVKQWPDTHSRTQLKNRLSSNQLVMRFLEQFPLLERLLSVLYNK